MTVQTADNEGVYIGQKSENMRGEQGKWKFDAEFSIWTVKTATTFVLGDWGYNTSDIGTAKDGYVTFKDMNVLASQWMECNDPINEDCETFVP